MSKVNGVYCWVVNGVIRYVGSGRDILDSRKSNHLSRLRKGVHCKGLQELYDMYGEEAFKFVVLEECNVKDLFIREKYYKNLYKDTITNVNDIVNTHKAVKTGLKAKQHKEKFKDMFSEENNPNARLRRVDVFSILDMVKDGINRELIAQKFKISKNYISRIGKDRWVEVYKLWIRKKDVLAVTNTSSATLSGLQTAQGM